MSEEKNYYHSRFDFIQYDTEATLKSELFKSQVQGLETLIKQIAVGRSASLALTALEECFMWIGKAIRDEQIARNGNEG